MADKNYPIICPGYMFQDTNGQAIQVQGAKMDLLGGSSATNTLIVAAVTGKIIRVLSFFARSGTLANTGDFSFTNGSGGAALMYGLITPANGMTIFDYNAYGWCDTGVGVALWGQTAPNVTISGGVRYIAFTPPT